MLSEAKRRKVDICRLRICRMYIQEAMEQVTKICRMRPMAERPRPRFMLPDGGTTYSWAILWPP